MFYSFPWVLAVEKWPESFTTDESKLEPAFVVPTSCQVVQTEMAEGCFGLIIASRVGPRRWPKRASVIVNLDTIEDRSEQAPRGLARLVSARLARDLSDRNQEAVWVTWASPRMQMR